MSLACKKTEIFKYQIVDMKILTFAFQQSAVHFPNPRANPKYYPLLHNRDKWQLLEQE